MSQGAASRKFRLGLGVRSFQAGRRLPFNLASVFVQVSLPAGLVGKADTRLTLGAKRCPGFTHSNRLGLVLQILLQPQVHVCHTVQILFGQSRLLKLHVEVTSPCQLAKLVSSSVLALCDWLRCWLTSPASRPRSGTKSSELVQPSNLSYCYLLTIVCSIGIQHTELNTDCNTTETCCNLCADSSKTHCWVLPAFHCRHCYRSPGCRARRLC